MRKARENMNMRIVCAALATLAAAFASAPPLHAATQKQSLTTAVKINAAVSPDCFVSTPSFSFTLGIGFVQAPGSATAKQSALSVRCTKGARVGVGLDLGLYGGATQPQFGTRAMKLSTSASYLGYELCRDSSCASVWAPSGYTYISPTDAGSTLPVWARITTGQRVFLGSYSDAVTATLNF